MRAQCHRILPPACRDKRELDVYLQRRGGLNISAARSIIDACEADGEHINRVGDKLANNVEHNRRHNRTLNKTYDMVAAVAVGQLGTKATRQTLMPPPGSHTRRHT